MPSINCATLLERQSRQRTEMTNCKENKSDAQTRSFRLDGKIIEML